MVKLYEKDIVDGSGTKSAVVLPIEDYRKLMEIVEEYKDIQDFDQRMSDAEWILIDDLKYLIKKSVSKR